MLLTDWCWPCFAVWLLLLLLLLPLLLMLPGRGHYDHWLIKR
jgi:hypothetical protein